VSTRATVDDGRDRRRTSALCAWFERHQRDLPWRRRRDGYTALVSEAMLQQTQVSRVVERFEAFVRRFPTVRALAEADEQEVLAMWSGLGYYRRARLLHAAARQVVAEHGGRVPSDVDTLRTLPGVGRYTAGAIASIVHGRPAPLVDGNVQRVLARWDADETPPATDSAAAERAWERAGQLVALADEPGVFNEGLMELGALICTPRAPSCLRCPVAAECEAARQGRQAEIPPPKPAAARRRVHHHALVIVRRGRLLLEQRGDDGLWSRMWQPPAVEAAQRMGVEAVGAAFAERSLPLVRLRRLGDFDHHTTHRLVTFHVFGGTTRRRRGAWHELDRLAELPMSNAHRRLVSDYAEAD
jgi:A/G-specific adenine glycosylase